MLEPKWTTSPTYQMMKETDAIAGQDPYRVVAQLDYYYTLHTTVIIAHLC